jgi:gas vesicle protein
MKNHGTSHLLIAFLGGAAAGAAIALLTAPRTGRETRERIGHSLQEGKAKTKQLPGAVKAAGGAAREAFSEAMGNNQ